MREIRIGRLDEASAGELLTLQLAAFVTEGRLYDTTEIPPLTQTLDELIEELRSPAVLAVGAWQEHRLVGGVRMRIDGATAHLERLVVAPDLRRRGIGSLLLHAGEDVLPAEVAEVRLFTGARSIGNCRLYEHHGYELMPTADAKHDRAGVDLVHFRKPLVRSR